MSSFDNIPKAPKVLFLKKKREHPPSTQASQADLNKSSESSSNANATEEGEKKAVSIKRHRFNDGSHKNANDRQNNLDLANGGHQKNHRKKSQQQESPTRIQLENLNLDTPTTQKPGGKAFRLQKKPGSSDASSSFVQPSAALQQSPAGTFVPTSFMSISNLDLPLRQTLVQECGFAQMTEAQQKTMLPLLLQKDVHLISKTGSGKTIAFLVPSLQKIIANRAAKRGGGGSSGGIQMLVISPTRELAMQIAKEATLVVSQYSFIRVGICIGGTNLESDKKKIRGGLEILVATPGRLLDLLSGGNFIRDVNTFVLDECDRLLDMGFAPDVQKIIGFLPKNGDRQNILCSATHNDQVDRILKALLKPDYVSVSTIPEGESNVHEKVPQFLIKAHFNEHLKTAMALIEREYSSDFKAIVFLPTAAAANLYYQVALSSQVLDKKFIFVQHSRQSQSKRIQVTAQFKDARCAVLFATDVVARGMDFPNVSHVVQVGVADDVETYIHRVGRTARAGRDGKGYIILANQELYLTPMLKAKKIPLQNMVLPVNVGVEKCVVRGLASFCREDSTNPGRAYQAWLGFYKSRMRQLGMNAETLVATANSFAQTHFQIIPRLEKKTIGKMGLKGTPGLL